MDEGAELEDRWRRPGSRRGLSGLTAAIVMAVVVLLIGSVGYVALGGVGHVGTSTATKQTCYPANSPGCTRVQAGAHDLSILVPFKTAQTNFSIPFTALLPSGESGSNFAFNFGDGQTGSSTTAPTVSHTYQYPGTYLVQVTAQVNGAAHDNMHALATINVVASFASPQAANAPNVAGQIVANSSSSTAPTAILAQGGTLSVLGSYTSLPTNPNFVPSPPTLTVSGGATSTPTATNTSVASTVTFATAGTYEVTMVASAKGVQGSPNANQTATQQYIWTVVVAPSGVNAGTAGGAQPASPHPGTIVAYESAPGGARSLDPAVAYDTVSFEPIVNVYEGLIMYNGSETGTQPSSFLPVISACVPGPNSASCQKLYGSTLYTSGVNSSGVPYWNYTFPLVHNSMFYDYHTGASWPAYPSDVVFSVARTLSFANLPSAGSNNGWILAQSILPGVSSKYMAANQGWDGGIHFPYNNTPQAIFAAMTVNGTDCPNAAMSAGNGCVTFHANGNDQNWPYFLELVADQQGASIVPCGWVSSTAGTGGQAGIPYWTQGNVSGAGDSPCKLPGGTTNTSDPAFQAAVNGIPMTGWDNFQELGSGTTSNGAGIGTPIHDMVGSGPYYLSAYSIGASYSLAANPKYTSNPYCTWTNCMPLPGHLANKVEVTWESSPAQGEQALAAGVADYATIPATDTALGLQLVQQGKSTSLVFPSLSTYFFPFTLNFNVAGAVAGQTNPVTVPSDWFSYVGMRQFFATAYPYATIQSTVLTSDGIQGGFNFGGAIPQFMGNYYPANVSWPSQDPGTACSGAGSSSPSCPTWWWGQITNPSSPYYDPQTTACTTSSPCQLPLFGQTGSPPLDQQQTLWVNSINSLSGGKLKVTYTDINFVNLVINSLFSSPGNNPMPFYTLGWAPDYPDPTDYVKPMWLPDSTYTFSNAVSEQLAQFNGTSCSHSFGYWANQPTVPQACQGAAYSVMVSALEDAAVMPGGPARELTYNMASHIGNLLALYTWQYQLNQVFNFGAWINVNSVNTNPTIGGGTVFTWYAMGGNNVWTAP